MAATQSKRQSRKRRRSAAANTPAGGANLPPPAPRTAREALRQRPARGHEQSGLSAALTGRHYGDPPPNRFGGLPVSELAILVGAVGFIVGFSTQAVLPFAVGVIVCTLAVGEFSAREHFSGYRSHTGILAAIPAVAIGFVLSALFGSVAHLTLFFVGLPIFLILYWLLRQRFRRARQARIARPPAP